MSIVDDGVTSTLQHFLESLPRVLVVTVLDIIIEALLLFTFFGFIVGFDSASAKED